jgi:F420-non-reducing hydrogenase large subunit
MKRVEIYPASRIEGHAKIAIFLNDEGEVENAFFQATELRGYEKFLVSMPIEEVPRVVSTICGICRAIHFVAALKASDAIYGVEPPDTAVKIREMLMHSHFVEDHTITLYALGLPDFISAESPEERNIFGLFKVLGKEVGRDILKKRGYAVKILEILGGKHIHPVSGIPGGWSKRIDEEERVKIEKYSKEILELGMRTVDIVENLIIDRLGALDESDGEAFELELNYIGTVDRRREMNLYNGYQRIVDPSGKEIGRFEGEEYKEIIAERVVPWSYSKIPYLRNAGWKGFVEGSETSLYMVGPVARFNVAERLSTPLAQEAMERMLEFAEERPVRNIILNHWARAIELLYAAEKLYDLSQDEEITDSSISSEISDVTGEGIGIVEAPRGLLIHHYITDSRGIVRNANLIVATTHNMGAINIAIKKVASKFIQNGKREDGIGDEVLNQIEMTFRAFDPCIACATHSINGKLPLEVEIYDSERNIIRKLSNF